MLRDGELQTCPGKTSRLRNCKVPADASSPVMGAAAVVPFPLAENGLTAMMDRR